MGAEEARPPRTPTTGGEGGFIVALEHSDLYFLLYYWREGVILHPISSLGLLTSRSPTLFRKAILGFFLGEKLWFANVHFTPWRGREVLRGASVFSSPSLPAAVSTL